MKRILQKRRLIVLRTAIVLLCVLVLGIAYIVVNSKKNPSHALQHPLATIAPPSNTTQTVSAQQTIVRDNNGIIVATFTKGARTVTLNGPSRTFSEPSTTAATVTTTSWVRLYPTVFDGTVDKVWLAQAQADDANAKLDILRTAMQYIAKAPSIQDTSGLKIASDAKYGPLQSDGSRQEGSDFNDYLGIPWTYHTNTGDVVDTPGVDQKGSIDCSGYQRMVWGYRNGMPLEHEPTGMAIPRRAYQILDSGPGIIIVANTKKQVTDLSQLQTGDLVFFDASTNDGDLIDHMGMYLGIDSTGQHRFISSRKNANGPTLGDIGGKSILEGNGLYASSFRAIRRF